MIRYKQNQNTINSNHSLGVILHKYYNDLELTREELEQLAIYKPNLKINTAIKRKK